MRASAMVACASTSQPVIVPVALARICGLGQRKVQFARYESRKPGMRSAADRLQSHSLHLPRQAIAKQDGDIEPLVTDESLPTFVCPICSKPLINFGDQVSGGGIAKSLKCINGHNYAIAKEGHVNLLRVGRKSKKRGTAGDENGMIRARRAFLDNGHFEPFAEAIANMVVKGIKDGGAAGQFKNSSEVVILDAGCGEGYYIGRVQEELLSAGIKATCFGIDIAPLAVRLASRRHKGVSFAVANAFELPFDDCSIDCVLTIFSPWPFEEFERILKPGGFVVAAGPGEQHLMGLKEILYDNPIPFAPRDFTSGTVGGSVAGTNPPPIAEAEQRISITIQVEGDNARNLLQMTPYWWKARPTQQAEIDSMPSISTPLEVLVSRHRYTC